MGDRHQEGREWHGRKRRKLVWKREDAQATGIEAQAQPQHGEEKEGELAGHPPTAAPAGGRPPAPAARGRAPTADPAKAELEALRARIAAIERELQQARHQAAKAGRVPEGDEAARRARRSRLEAGFSQVPGQAEGGRVLFLLAVILSFICLIQLCRLSRMLALPMAVQQRPQQSPPTPGKCSVSSAAAPTMKCCRHVMGCGLTD